MFGLIYMVLLVAEGRASITSLLKTDGNGFIGSYATITATHNQDAINTAATFECLHGATVLGEIGIRDDGTLLPASVVYYNRLSNRITLSFVSSTTFTLSFATLQYVDHGVIITCRNKADTTDKATYTIALTAYMNLKATSSSTVPVVDSLLEITGSWTGVYSDASTIEVTCGTEVTQLPIATVTILAAGNVKVDQDNENAPVVIGAAEVGGTFITLFGNTIKLTIFHLQQTDVKKICKFTQTFGDVATYTINGDFKCKNIFPIGIEVEMTSSGCNQTTYQTKGCQVVFKCSDGYYGKSVVSTCNDAYQWTNGQPTCIRQCDAHPSNVNVLLSSGTGCSNTLYNLAKCESLFGCSDGLIGDKTMSTCKEDGIWTGEFPTCKN